MDKATAFYMDSMERGQRYVTFLIAAGFAAFFTIWGSFRPLLPAPIVLVTGSMMGTSLVLFIGFEIWKAHVMSVQNARMSRALAGATIATFDKVMAAEEKISRKAALLEVQVWPWVFAPTVLLGVGSAVILVVSGFFGAA